MLGRVRATVAAPGWWAARASGLPRASRSRSLRHTAHSRGRRRGRFLRRRRLLAPRARARRVPARRRRARREPPRSLMVWENAVRNRGHRWGGAFGVRERSFRDAQSSPRWSGRRPVMSRLTADRGEKILWRKLGGPMRRHCLICEMVLPPSGKPQIRGGEVVHEPSRRPSPPATPGSRRTLMAAP